MSRKCVDIIDFFKYIVAFGCQISPIQLTEKDNIDLSSATLFIAAPITN